MKKGIGAIVSVINGLKSIQTIKKGLTTVYESFKELLISGIPPLTLLNVYHNKSNEKYNKLIDYKIYGESVQDGTPTSDTPIEIESVGEKTVNLLQLYDNLDQTINGVKIKVNSDKSISVNGTCTANITITIADFDLKQGITYYYSGCPAGGSSSTYNLYFGYGGADMGNGDSITPSRDISDSPIKLRLYSGQVYENLTFYPMINAKTKSKVYEPYGYRIPVKVNGKNILHTRTSGNVEWMDNSGITGVYNSDGSVTLNAGTNKQSYVCNARFTTTDSFTIEKAGTVTLSCKGRNSTLYIVLGIKDVDTGKVSYQSLMWVSKVTFDVKKGDIITPYIQIKASGTIEETTLYPQLEYDDTSSSYEPYVKPVTTNIYLKEPLRKIGDYKDYIDFINKKVIRNVQELVVTGNETTWENAGSISRFKIDTNRITANSGGNSINQLCNYFVCDNITTTNSLTGVSVYYSASLNGTFFRIRDNENFGQSTANIVAFFKEKYNESKPCKILFDLYNPKEETLNLPDILTHKGTNIIEIDTSIISSNMEVKYYGK